MKVRSLALIGVGLALWAGPALAFTLMPSQSTPPARQFADPDAVFDGFSSSYRDNALGAGGGAFGGFALDGGGEAAMAASSAGYSGEGSGIEDARPSTTSGTGAASWVGLRPAASDLYDGEPPFMPQVVDTGRR